MDKCNNCQQTPRQITLYICGKCKDSVCEDCFKTSHSYDREYSELLCPKCLKDLIDNRNDERDYHMSVMKSYVHLE